MASLAVRRVQRIILQLGAEITVLAIGQFHLASLPGRAGGSAEAESITLCNIHGKMTKRGVSVKNYYMTISLT